MSALVAALLLALATTPRDSPAAPAGRRVALFVGRNDGGPERAALRWAHQDAAAMAALMGSLGGVPEAQRFLLLEPDRAALDGTLMVVQAQLAAVPAGVRSELMFYYSGHADALGLLLGRERYPFAELRARLDAVSADLRLVVVDACASGALLSERAERAKGGVKTAPFLAESDLAGHAYLTSAAADEVAQESDRLEASFFTHALLTALRGAADRDKDRTVTLTEAYRYAFDATLARTAATPAPQHPAWDIALSGAGDVVLTWLERPSARLLFSGELAGRFFVRDQREVLLAELTKDAGDTLELALPPGSLRVATVAGGRRLEASLLLADAPLTLSSKDFADVGPALDARARGDAPVRLRLSILPLLAFDGPGERAVVHGLAFALLGDRVLAVRGAQLATLFNGAEDVTGTQIGLINVAGRVRGAQIGLINVAERLEGASLGLVPWVGGPDGLRHLEVYASGAMPLALGWRIGARWLHTALALATDFSDCSLQLAVGSEIDLAPVALGFDLGPQLAARRCAPAHLGSEVEVALRALLALRVAPGVRIFAGGSAALATDDGAFRPGFIAGIRLFE